MAIHDTALPFCTSKCVTLHPWETLPSQSHGWSFKDLIARKEPLKKMQTTRRSMSKWVVNNLLTLRIHLFTNRTLLYPTIYGSFSFTHFIPFLHRGPEPALGGGSTPKRPELRGGDSCAGTEESLVSWSEVATEVTFSSPMAQGPRPVPVLSLYHHPWTTTIEAPRAYLTGRMGPKKNQIFRC
jgi:hypothetical protein